MGTSVDGRVVWCGGHQNQNTLRRQIPEEVRVLLCQEKSRLFTQHSRSVGEYLVQQYDTERYSDGTVVRFFTWLQHV